MNHEGPHAKVQLPSVLSTTALLHPFSGSLAFRVLEAASKTSTYCVCPSLFERA